MLHNLRSRRRSRPLPTRRRGPDSPIVTTESTFNAISSGAYRLTQAQQSPPSSPSDDGLRKNEDAESFTMKYGRETPGPINLAAKSSAKSSNDSSQTSSAILPPAAPVNVPILPSDASAKSTVAAAEVPALFHPNETSSPANPSGDSDSEPLFYDDAVADHQTFNLAFFLHTIRTTDKLYGPDTNRILQMSSNTSTYEMKKAKMTALFYTSFINSPLAHLRDMVPSDDKDTTSPKIRRLVALTRGDPSPAKYEILNAALLYFSRTKVKVTHRNKVFTTVADFVKAQYQPNTTAGDFRMLFSIFASEGIRYSLSKHFNVIGGFVAFWKTVYITCEQHDPSFGKTPNQATFDDLFRIKRERCHADPNHPFIVFDETGKVINFMNLMMVLVEEFKIVYCLRSSKEPRNIRRSDLLWGEETTYVLLYYIRYAHSLDHTL